MHSRPAGWAAGLRRRVIPPGLRATDGEESYSGLSVLCVAILLLLTIVAVLVIRWTRGWVPPLVIAWVELFEVREVFDFAIFGDEWIRGAYDLVVTVATVLAIARSAVALLRLGLSRLVLAADHLMIVEHVLFCSRIHYIPYDRIVRITSRQSVLHRLSDTGSVAVITGEMQRPLAFGPISGYTRFIDAITGRMGGA